jgi:hypothetical protein
LSRGVLLRLLSAVGGGPAVQRRTVEATGLVTQGADEEAAIRKLIADRERTWNEGDVDVYGRLFTRDADISTATGEGARGRDAMPS